MALTRARASQKVALALGNHFTSPKRKRSGPQKKNKVLQPFGKKTPAQLQKELEELTSISSEPCSSHTVTVADPFAFDTQGMGPLFLSGRFSFFFQPKHQMTEPAALMPLMKFWGLPIWMAWTSCPSLTWKSPCSQVPIPKPDDAFPLPPHDDSTTTGQRFSQVWWTLSWVTCRSGWDALPHQSLPTFKAHVKILSTSGKHRQSFASTSIVCHSCVLFQSSSPIDRLPHDQRNRLSLSNCSTTPCAKRPLSNRALSSTHCHIDRAPSILSVPFRTLL